MLFFFSNVFSTFMFLGILVQHDLGVWRGLRCGMSAPLLNLQCEIAEFATLKTPFARFYWLYLLDIHHPGVVYKCWEVSSVATFISELAYRRVQRGWDSRRAAVKEGPQALSAPGCTQRVAVQTLRRRGDTNLGEYCSLRAALVDKR